MGDTFYNPDPLTAGDFGDVFMNTKSGDVWFDVITHYQLDTAWDILNALAQDTAWDIRNENKQDIAWDILNLWLQNVSWDILNDFDQDISWSIFADTLFFLQQLYLKEIRFDFYTKPEYYLGVPADNMCNLWKYPNFDIQIHNKPQYTFYISAEFGAGLENFEKRN
jgi:hypothetical protein